MGFFEDRLAGRMRDPKFRAGYREAGRQLRSLQILRTGSRILVTLAALSAIADLAVGRLVIGGTVILVMLVGNVGLQMTRAIVEMEIFG